MTITRSGSTKKYVAGWETAFGKKKTTKSPRPPRKKSRKKSQQK